MLEQMPDDFRTSFLLKLTKEIIENTSSYKEFKVKEEVKDFIKQERERKIPPPIINRDIQEIKRVEIRKEKVKKFVGERIKKDFDKISEMRKVDLLPELKRISKPIQKPKTIKIPPVLRIPESALPETVSYLKPTPTSEKIDIGKMNIMVRDPLVKIMECNGPEENILVTGIMGRKPTPIKLSKQEIEEIVGKFAAAAKIPVNEGLFKAAIGNLVISAVISETVGIKFIIRKIYAGF